MNCALSSGSWSTRSAARAGRDGSCCARSRPAALTAASTAPDAPDGATAWDASSRPAIRAPTSSSPGWAAVKAVNGWSRASAHGPSRERATPSAPRSSSVGPGRCRGASATPRAARSPRTWDAATIAAFSDAVRHDLRPLAGRVSHVRIDPEIERDAGPDADGASAPPCARPAGDRRRRSSPARRGSSTSGPTRPPCGATCARSGAST